MESAIQLETSNFISDIPYIYISGYNLNVLLMNNAAYNRTKIFMVSKTLNYVASVPNFRIKKFLCLRKPMHKLIDFILL